VKATWKQPDGIVKIDYDACIGCRYCITACPYQARTFDFGENWADNAAKGEDAALALRTGRDYEAEPNFEYGRPWTREASLLDALPNSPIGNARKCNFCEHRLEVGMLPMCVTTCIGRATFFGDLNDTQALVSELIVRNDAMRLKEEVGTEPKVFYLV
jgi:molybdopterin-containing oxidoreductase family iron-sulfur binding subunit